MIRLLARIAICVAVFATAASADEQDAAEYNAQAGGVSFLVMRGGVVKFEDYPNGGAATKAWELASGTKSFSCAIAAAAVGDGLLNLDEKAADTLTEWNADSKKSKVTIRQILTLTSGVKPMPVGRAPSYAAAVAQPMASGPGTVFEYGPVNFLIFGEIMRRKLKSYDNGRYEDALDYLNARVLTPIGAAPADWKIGIDGYPILPQGAKYTARNWAKYGLLALEGGEWNGATLIDKAVFAECFRGSRANPAYGLTWWLNEAPSPATLKASRTMTVATDLFSHPRRGEIPPDLFMAAGAGGQRLYVIPSLDLIVVRQYPRMIERRFGRKGAPKFSDVEFLSALLNP